MLWWLADTWRVCGLKHQNNLICEVYQIARAVCVVCCGICILLKGKRQVIGSSDSRCYIDVMSQMSIWTLFWYRVTVSFKWIEQFWQQSQTKVRGIILHAKSVCLVGLYVWGFYIGEDMSAFLHKKEIVEQHSNRKGVVIRGPNMEPKPIWEYHCSFCDY